jgi:TolB-like protein/class 3 adenylate cyclase
MSGDRVERRLAAILAADVAGYSRLMEADEEGTLADLRAIRHELGDPKMAEHRGRIVKTTGDGLLAEFASVVAAVRYAVELQRAMAERNAEVPPARRIEFRIGIHQGDIIVEDGDIFGDGVNVAARLEGLAEPGGICVSARVREDAAGKIELAFRDMGEQQLKNIARPVRAYAVGAAASPTRHSRRRIVTSRLAAAAIILAVAGIGSTVWWAWPRLNPPPTTANAIPTTNPPTASEAKPTPRLSIVVLPFANLSNDPEQQYFADGITDDLTTDLSRLRNVLVISRSTAFTYKGQGVDAKKIGRELGVRYVLEGSVRRSGTQVRINTQLIDASNDTHLWAEHFDQDIGDVFAIQNEITNRIANTLGFELISAETARPTDRPDALDYILRGRAVMGGGGPRGNIEEEAIGLFEHALALDPRSVETQSLLANALWLRASSKTPEAAAADLQRAEELIAQALAAAPSDPLAHRVKGRLLRFERRCGDAVPEIEISLAADRNNPNSLVELSICKFLTGGSDQEAIALTEQAMRLSPRDPGMSWWYTWIGFVHLLQSRTDQAIAWLEKGRSARLGANPPHWFLAAAYGFKGELELARAELAEAMKLTGSDRYSSVARTRANGDLYTPALRDRWETTYIPGIRAAGLPEE